MKDKILPEDLVPIIEAMIMAAEKPLSLKEIISLFPKESQPSTVEVQDALLNIAQHTENRGYELKQVATGYRMQVRPEYASWVGRVLTEKPTKLSRAFLETLALIAYRQPITRGEIEAIRGVQVSAHIIRTLTEFGWCREIGHKEVPGRPALFATTKQFLDDFNLENLESLPELKPLKEIDENAIEAQLEAVTGNNELQTEDTENEQNENSVEHESYTDTTNDASEAEATEDDQNENLTEQASDISDFDEVMFTTVETNQEVIENEKNTT